MRDSLELEGQGSEALSLKQEKQAFNLRVA